MAAGWHPANRLAILLTRCQAAAHAGTRGGNDMNTGHGTAGADDRRQPRAGAGAGAGAGARRGPGWCWWPATPAALRAAVADIRAARRRGARHRRRRADKDATYAIAGQAAALVGPIDLLINNASTLGPVPLRLLLDTDCEDLERALAVNLVGPVPADQGDGRADGAARARAGGERHLGRRRRGLPALGRLRRVEGGAGSAGADLGGRAGRHRRARAQRRPGRDEHAHARRGDARRRSGDAGRSGARGRGGWWR